MTVVVLIVISALLLESGGLVLIRGTAMLTGAIFSGGGRRARGGAVRHVEQQAQPNMSRPTSGGCADRCGKLRRCFYD